MQRSALPISNPGTPPIPAPIAGTTRAFLIGDETRGRAYLRALIQQSGTAIVAAELPDVDSAARPDGGALPDVVVLVRAHTADDLASAVKKVQEHELWLDRASVARLIEGLSAEHAHAAIPHHDPMFGKLAECESEIVELVAQGLCNKSIASRLDISDNTVRHRLTSVFGKLGVHGRLALAVCAFRSRNL